MNMAKNGIISLSNPFPNERAVFLFFNETAFSRIMLVVKSLLHGHRMMIDAP